MKKLFLISLIFLFSLSLTSAGVAIGNNQTLIATASTSAGGTQNADSLEGVWFVPNVNISVFVITDDPLSTAPNCVVLSAPGGTHIANGTYSGQNCTIYANLTAGTEYLIGSNGAGDNRYETGFGGVNLTLGNFTKGFYGAYSTKSFMNATNIYNILRITVADYNFSASHSVVLNSPQDNGYDIGEKLVLNASIISNDNTLANITFFLWNSLGTEVNKTNLTLSGTSNIDSTLNLSVNNGEYEWNAYVCNVDSCSWATTNNSFVYGLADINVSYVPGVYETDSQVFNVTFNVTSGTPTANLYWNGTKYTSTGTNLEGNKWNFLTNLVIPLINGTKNIFWEIISGELNYNTTVKNQAVADINLSLCGSAPINKVYFNITFKNETATQQRINASVLSSLFTYWLGSDRSVNKTTTYSTTTEYKEYDFCFYPQNRSFNSVWDFTYTNEESEQRTYEITSPTTYSNTTSNFSLFLLPSSSGLYVTIQVVNVALEPQSGATILVSRTGYGNLESKMTDDSGSATFWLNPNFQYTFAVSKTGFNDLTTSITPAQSSYTLTLSTATTTNNITDISRGISFDIAPGQDSLINNTNYVFNLTMTSSYWSLSSWGYYLTNSSGYVLAQNSSTTGSGGYLQNVMNTGLNESIYMKVFYIANGTTANFTRIWYVFDETNARWSIKNLFTNLGNYLDDGIFGLEKGFGLNLAIFVFIFLLTGVFSLRFGVTSSTAIVGMIFVLVVLFDAVLGLIETSVPRASSIVMFIVLITVIIREAIT